MKEPKENIKPKKKHCPNCGSPWIVKTYDGYWCKNCKTEI